MKRIIGLCLAALAGLALTSCEKEDGIKLSDLDGWWFAADEYFDGETHTAPKLCIQIDAAHESAFVYAEGEETYSYVCKVSGKHLKMSNPGSMEKIDYTISKLSKKFVKFSEGKDWITFWNIGNCLPGHWTANSGSMTADFKKNGTAKGTNNEKELTYSWSITKPEYRSSSPVLLLTFPEGPETHVITYFSDKNMIWGNMSISWIKE